MNGPGIVRKQCSSCKDWRPVADFHKEKSKPLGLQSRCRFCKEAEGKKRRQEEREKAEAAAKLEALQAASSPGSLKEPAK